MNIDRKKGLASVIGALCKAIDDKDYKIEVATKISDAKMLDKIVELSIKEKRVFVVPKTLHTSWITSNLAGSIEDRNGYKIGRIDGLIVYKSRLFSFNFETDVRTFRAAIYEDEEEEGKYTLNCYVCQEDFAFKEHQITIGDCKCAGNICYKCYYMLLLKSVETDTPLCLECPYCRKVFIEQERLVKGIGDWDIKHVLSAFGEDVSIKNPSIAYNILFLYGLYCFKSNRLTRDEAEMLEEMIREVCEDKGIKLMNRIATKPGARLNKVYAQFMRSLVKKPQIDFDDE